MDWVQRLHDLGQRATPARCAVLEVLSATPEHLSADEIAAEVSSRAPDVHRATVFRTLDRLVSLRLVAHVHLPHGATTYHLRRAGQRMHLHMLCRGCGEVYDIDASLLDDVVTELRSLRGFELDPAHSALSGRCHDCLEPPRDRHDRSEASPEASPAG